MPGLNRCARDSLNSARAVWLHRSCGNLQARCGSTANAELSHKLAPLPMPPRLRFLAVKPKSDALSASVSGGASAVLSLFLRASKNIRRPNATASFRHALPVPHIAAPVLPAWRAAACSARRLPIPGAQQHNADNVSLVQRATADCRWHGCRRFFPMLESGTWCPLGFISRRKKHLQATEIPRAWPVTVL